VFNGVALRSAAESAAAVILCVPMTLSTSCDQVIFVDQATDVCLFPDAVQVEIDRFR
jgi:hypothetical protein